MNLNDIVFLKSSNEKLMITWLVGVTENRNVPIDINKKLMMRPEYQVGDIAVEYAKGKKFTIPGISLIDNLANRLAPVNLLLSVGNVVKHKLSGDEMTIIWIVGQEQISKNPINLNKLYLNNGYQNGDIVCGYFEKRTYTTKLFKAEQVDKIYE